MEKQLIAHLLQVYILTCPLTLASQKLRFLCRFRAWVFNIALAVLLVGQVKRISLQQSV
jgi:hypothetical protein